MRGGAGCRAVPGALGVGLALRAVRDLGGLHGRAPLRPGGLAVVVLEQDRGEVPAHVPLHVEGQHAQEHVGADMVLRVDVHGPDPQPRGLHRAERALHAGEALVRLHRGMRAHGGGLQAGAHDVDPVEAGLRPDPVRVALPVHPGVVHGDVEVLLHLAPVGVAPQGLDRPVAVRRPRLPAGSGGGDVGERPFRGLQQVLPLAAPFLAQPRVQADHEPLAGEVRAGDLRHRVRRQRLGLQRGRRTLVRGLQQLADVPGLQGRDPVEPGRLEVLADAGRGQHPPVADQRHAVDAEALADLVHLIGERGGIGRVPGEHLDRCEPPTIGP